MYTYVGYINTYVYENIKELKRERCKDIMCGVLSVVKKKKKMKKSKKGDGFCNG